MSLLERLSHEDPNSLPVHTFWASLHELHEGRVTRQNVIDYFELVGQDVTDLDYIIARYQAQPNANAKVIFVHAIHALFILGSANVPGYRTDAQLRAILDAM